MLSWTVFKHGTRATPPSPAKGGPMPPTARSAVVSYFAGEAQFKNTVCNGALCALSRTGIFNT